MIGSVLVANRGEIAVRLIRTYRELGVRTIAVYSDADAAALHVRLADEARHLGPAPVTASYLNQRSGHRRRAGGRGGGGGPRLRPAERERRSSPRPSPRPGWSSSGRRPRSSRPWATRLAARAIARRAGVPVVPGSGEISSPSRGWREAARLGYPVLVKAVGGGGGRGMRVAQDAAALPGALAAAAAEAAAAFGRAEVYLERYLAGRPPRRGPGPRRRSRHRAVPGRPRLLGAAAPPEADRGGAGAVPAG